MRECYHGYPRSKLYGGKWPDLRVFPVKSRNKDPISGSCYRFRFIPVTSVNRMKLPDTGCVSDTVSEKDSDSFSPYGDPTTFPSVSRPDTSAYLRRFPFGWKPDRLFRFLSWLRIVEPLVSRLDTQGKVVPPKLIPCVELLRFLNYRIPIPTSSHISVAEM